MMRLPNVRTAGAEVVTRTPSTPAFENRCVSEDREGSLKRANFDPRAGLIDRQPDEGNLAGCRR